MSADARQKWFASILQAGFEEEMLGAPDVLAHVTPELLAAHLPGEILGELLARSLETRNMTPEGVLGTVTPELLAEHIPHEVLWACISAAAERAGLTKAERNQ